MLFIIMMNERFSISVELGDLRERIAATRWPDEIPDIGWQQGTPRDHLRRLLTYWASEFDWAATQRHLNTFAHYRTDDGIHFVHSRAPGGNGTPIILTHGWPSSFLEYLPVMSLLANEFDLVIPSLPGYGLSARPLRTGVNYRFVADRWHALMQSLGYSRYGAGGGDFGAGVATFLALDHPDAVTGIHLTTAELAPAAAASAEDVAYLAVNDAWAAAERGYSSIQSSKPQTVGYGLNDSPAGLAAWLLEKWHSWSDVTPPDDFLCATLTLYWATSTITSSMRDYWDNRWHRVTPGYVRTPTAFALFPHEKVAEGSPPRSFLAQLYNIQRWTVHDRGGHFAAIEQPSLVASDLAAFFRV